jgi:hypothetical protein
MLCLPMRFWIGWRPRSSGRIPRGSRDPRSRAPVTVGVWLGKLRGVSVTHLTGTRTRQRVGCSGSDDRRILGSEEAC